MMRILIFVTLLAFCRGQGEWSDLDSVFKQIFGYPNSQTTANPLPQASTLVPGISDNEDGDKSCKMEDGRIGECVRYYLCTSVITEGVGINVFDGPCTSYMDLCCPPPDSKDITNSITPPPTTQPQRQGCGWRNTEGVVIGHLATSWRITSDTDGKSKFGEFPWMVAVIKVVPVNDNEPNSQKLNVYVSGGSLIHPSIVLTAAHNVTGAKALRARAGEWNVHTTKEIYPHQDRDVARIEVHKDFNKDKLFYDIALLFLAQPMDLTPNVGVVCLPPPRERVPGGTRCFASGWGKDKFGKEGRYQFILKKVEVPVVERSTCQTQLQNTSLGHSFELHTSFMCAGGEAGKDTCEGDGGSPLSCPIEYETDRYMQSGIVTWGIGCGEVGIPGVYVDVSNLRNWIDDQVAGAGYDPMTYTI